MTVPIPFPDTLPAAWQWFLGLSLVVFPVHLLLMNAMLGFAVLSLHFLLKGGETDRRLAGELAKGLPVLVALAVNFGVAALLFLQVLYGQFSYASSVLMAVFWLGVPALLLVAYYAAYLYDFRFDSLGKGGAAAIALASSLFFAIAFLFANNWTLMIEPFRWGDYFSSPGGTLLNARGAPFWARYLHFLTAGLAVGGVAVAVFGRWKQGKDPALGERAVEAGMRFFTMLTMLQFLLGVWYLGSLPRPVMLLFMGGSRAATAALAAGVALSFALVFAGLRRKVGLSAGLAAAAVYVMAFLRHEVRAGYLLPFYRPEMRTLAPEYGPLAAFLVSLLIGAAVIAWMVRKTIEAYRETK